MVERREPRSPESPSVHIDVERSGNWRRLIRLIRGPVKCLLAPAADVLRRLLGAHVSR